MHRQLRELLGERFDDVIEKIDIVTNPKRTFRDGIRMIPALKCNDRVISGIFLTRRQLVDFLASSGFNTPGVQK